MTFDPRREPFRSILLEMSGDRAEDDSVPDDASAFWTGLSVEDLAAVGSIASHAGVVEMNMWRVLRIMLGGFNAETWIMTKGLQAAQLTARIREIATLDRWHGLSARSGLTEMLAEVDAAMRERNLVLHGGVNGSAIDPSEFAYFARRDPSRMTDAVHTLVLPKDELTRIAARFSILDRLSWWLFVETIDEAAQHSSSLG